MIRLLDRLNEALFSFGRESPHPPDSNSPPQKATEAKMHSLDQFYYGAVKQAAPKKAPQRDLPR